MFAPRIVKPESAPPQRSAVASQRPSHTAVAQGQLPLRAIGNQAMLRLLAQRAGATRNEPGAQQNEDSAAPVPGRETAPSWDFSKIPVSPPGRVERFQRPSQVPARLPGPSQPNLKVGAVDDPLEHEAVRAADQVMRTPDPHGPVAIAAPPGTSRAGPAGRDEDRLQGEPAGSQGSDSEAPAVINEALRSPGQPLDTETRNLLGPRFGTGFAGVRVHRGPLAEQSARGIGARAFTVGQDIVFGAGAFAPATPDGRRLLAHELTHVVQQAGTGPFVQRQPHRPEPGVRPKTKSPKAPKDPDPKRSPFVPADLVQELKRDNETWTLTIDGLTEPDSVRHLIWPSRVPPGVTVTLEVGIQEPIERGWFELNGVTFDTLKTMEPSFAKLFSAHGLEDESEESAGKYLEIVSPYGVSAQVSTQLWGHLSQHFRLATSVAVRDARASFRQSHKGHGDWILNTIDFALKKITKRNPELLIAYYNYYADHELRDEKHWWEYWGYDADKNTAVTSSGDTLINPSVLRLESRFPSDDPTSLLAGTLIHEYSHTPHGGASAFGDLPKEAKSFGIEVFFSKRMRDKAREDFITNYMSSHDPWSNFAEASELFNKSYRIMQALYKVIDQGGPAAKDAREMSVEYISKNSDDFGAKLKDFIANVP